MSVSVHENKTGLVTYLFPSWLLSVYVFGLLTRISTGEAEHGNLVMGGLLAGLSWPAVFFLLNSGLRKNFLGNITDKKWSGFLIIYNIVCVLSVYKSVFPMFSLGYLASIDLALILAYSFSSAMSDEDMRRGLVIYGVSITFVLVGYALYSGIGEYGRLEGVMNPNATAMVAVSAVLAATQSRRLWVIAVICAADLWVLMLANSRSAIVSMAVGMVAWFFVKKKRLPGFGVAALVMLVMGVLVLLLPVYGDAVYQFMVDLFLVNDKYRGLGSGGTGRIVAWGEAWDIFMTSPIIGVGYRTHEYYMRSYSSAHNGYLSMLADTGVLGTAAVLGFVFVAIKNYMLMDRTGIVMLAVAIISAFLFIGIFERYMFNAGNPASLIVMVFLVRGFVGDRLRSRENKSEGLIGKRSGESALGGSFESCN